MNSKYHKSKKKQKTKKKPTTNKWIKISLKQKHRKTFLFFFAAGKLIFFCSSKHQSYLSSGNIYSCRTFGGGGWWVHSVIF